MERGSQNREVSHAMTTAKPRYSNGDNPEPVVGHTKQFDLSTQLQNRKLVSRSYCGNSSFGHPFNDQSHNGQVF